jgi:hypothetical protein
MRIKRLCSALLASLALAAIFATSAFAFATESKGHWVVEGKNLTGSKSLACTIPVVTDFILRGKVLGTTVEIVADRATCPESSISNPGEFAIGSGKLQFTGVTVKQPLGCQISSTINTASLATQAMMEGTKVYVRFKPVSGTTVMSLSLTGCAAEGTYPLKGTFFGQSPNLTKTEKPEQALAFSGTINTIAGGALTLGTESATLTGEENFSVFGSAWGVTE